jgi:hypothetical protein
MNVTDPVRRVSVVSTGQVRIRPDHVASSWHPMAWWLLATHSQDRTGRPELTAYGMHWSRWTGRYGRHGLIAGRAGGIGHLHGCDEGCFSLGRVTIVLSGVTNFGVNATTYYERLHIIGGKHVAHYWHWSRHHDNYVPLTVTRPEDASPAPGRVARAAWLIVSPRPIVDWGGSLAGEPAPAPRSCGYQAALPGGAAISGRVFRITGTDSPGSQLS